MGQTYKEAFPYTVQKGLRYLEALWSERVLDPAS